MLYLSEISCLSYNLTRHRVKIMPYTRITKRVLLWDMYNQSLAPHKNFYSSEIRSILNQNGLLHFYSNDIKPNILRKILKETLYEKDMKTCQLVCLNSPQLKTYNAINDFNVEKIQLQIPLNFKFKSTFCKFKMSTLPLRIVTGRWERPKIVNNERYCLQCSEYIKYDKFFIRQNIDHIYDYICETELHFALKCEKHTVIRNNFFKSINISYFENCNTERELLFVLCNNKALVRKFAMYITNCYDNHK